jgi:excisionase family DNA binding protein
MRRVENETYLSPAEVAARLGLKSVTIRSWIARRKIASVRVGERALRIPLSEVERLIEAGFTPAEK